MPELVLKTQQWMNIISLLGFIALQVSAGGFLVERPAGWEAKIQAETIRSDLEQAVAEAMGQGHGVEQSRLLEIREYLSNMFKSLPKNSYGRVEKSMVRYALHRYFAEKYAITVTGLEPTKSKNARQGQAGAQILLDNVPGYAETLLEGRFAHHGFGVEDAVVMTATLEQLVLGSGTLALQKAYKLQNFDTNAKLTRADLEAVLNAYVLQWLVGDSADIDSLALKNHRSQIEESVPQWHTIKEFARGEVDRVEHLRRSSNPFVSETLYGFNDIQNIVRSITEHFGHFWEHTCQEIKGSLMAVEDSSNAGRVRLSSFYRRNVEGGEWRFGESESYLRELGVLDDTSMWRGPQVIIPNYMQAASNCIITSTYYRVCCVNECEARLKQVEDAVQTPVATPSQIFGILENMTRSEVIRPNLQKSLEQQLNRIAETHNGKVPVHGRLFAQWMHYVFPQDCPFPQQKVEARTPAEFGDDHIASEAEMHKHIQEGKRSDSNRQKNGVVEEHEEERWSQWLHDEELLVDYADLQPRRVSMTSLFILAMLLVAVGVAFRGVSINHAMSKDSFCSLSASLSAKQHLV